MAAARSEKLNFTDAGRASNGRLNAAPSEAFESAKMPTSIAGNVSEYDALMPLGVTVRPGGSEKPLPGM